jgi:hypothetical protein
MLSGCRSRNTDMAVRASRARANTRYGLSTSLATSSFADLVIAQIMRVPARIADTAIVVRNGPAAVPSGINETARDVIQPIHEPIVA